jgi:hypothetical protein
VESSVAVDASRIHLRFPIYSSKNITTLLDSSLSSVIIYEVKCATMGQQRFVEF